MEYYRLAHNISVLNKLRWIMDRSLVMTLAHKLGSTASKVRKRYATTLEVDGKSYQDLQITISGRTRNLW